jgi:hypothetical protein
METLGSIETPVTTFLGCLTLKMLALRATETSVTIYDSTQHNTSQDRSAVDIPTSIDLRKLSTLETY